MDADNDARRQELSDMRQKMEAAQAKIQELQVCAAPRCGAACAPSAPETQQSTCGGQCTGSQFGVRLSPNSPLNPPTPECLAMPPTADGGHLVPWDPRAPCYVSRIVWGGKQRSPMARSVIRGATPASRPIRQCPDGGTRTAYPPHPLAVPPPPLGGDRPDIRGGLQGGRGVVCAHAYPHTCN